MHDIDALLQQATQDISTAADLKTLDQHRITYLGKKGSLTACLKSLGTLPPEERREQGQHVNTVKLAVQTLFDEKQKTLEAADLSLHLAADSVDVTLPGRSHGCGSIHPINQTFATLRSIFTRMGFAFMTGPEIESEYNNFTALNVPPLHPARAMQDTFYFRDQRLLRSQTSPVQIRAMAKQKPPLRMVAMGRVYRRDFDLTHTPMFHQMECLMIDEDITFADLKGLLQTFLSEFFATHVKMRLRPSYFPFTEPSAEVDMACLNCEGQGCRICKMTGYLEILGCGMVHPNVLREAGIDSERYRGFAFGLGVDRLTLLKHKISDLRALFENDLRFLQQL